MAPSDQRPYADLGPEVVLDAVDALGLTSDGRLLALNSYENRVYRVGLDDGRAVVAKFYRPGRWSNEAILEEHTFAVELRAAELSVIAPLAFGDSTLHEHRGYRYALFPNQGGHAPETDDADVLRQIGRTLGRLHQVGASARFRHRPQLTIERFGSEPVAWLTAHDWLPAHLRESFAAIAVQLLAEVERIWRLAGTFATLRLHGDCHPGNLLWRDGQAHFVDLDDALTGPAIQDLWMLLAGDEDDQRRQLDALLEGYALFRDLDPMELRLIEPLRTLRLLHYHAWIARRWHDPAFPPAFPWFVEERHWQSLIGQLQEQLALLRECDGLPWPP